MHQSRKLSVYERNQLLKYSLQETDLLTKGNLPVEYLTGFVDFAGLQLQVDSNVLIPRVETEELVEPIINFIKKNAQSLRYLEVGTGSGALSLAVLAALKNLPAIKLKKFMLTDVSVAALNLARKNLQKLFDESLQKQVSLLQSNLLAKIPSQTFDVIVSNLPYIPSKEIASLDSSVKDFEPHLALDGGETGFELIAAFLQQIIDRKFLATNGKIFLEVHESHDTAFIEEFYPEFLSHFQVRQIKDQFERQRFLILELL